VAKQCRDCNACRRKLGFHAIIPGELTVCEVRISRP
jgi:hypothetical protein